MIFKPEYAPAFFVSERKCLKMAVYCGRIEAEVVFTGSDVRNCPLYYTRSVSQNRDKRRKTAVLTNLVSEVLGKYAAVPLAFNQQIVTYPIENNIYF